MVPVEFMLVNGAKIDMKDDRGQSALHHATLMGHTGYVGNRHSYCQFVA